MTEDSDKVGEQEENVTGTETPINLVPVAMKTPSVATYKIIKQGEKGDNELIVMNRYGMDGPEDKLEKGFWKCLRVMFEEPLSTDFIWSEIGQQKIISWRYYDTCRVHCLNLESMDVYMLSDRKYPLSAEMSLNNDLRGLNRLYNWYRSLVALDLGFYKVFDRVLVKKHEAELCSCTTSTRQEGCCFGLYSKIQKEDAAGDYYWLLADLFMAA
ncbi:hypothetical protein Tco_0401617 [Tanacetum coccineum]